MSLVISHLTEWHMYFFDMLTCSISFSAYTHTLFLCWECLQQSQMWGSTRILWGSYQSMSSAIKATSLSYFSGKVQQQAFLPRFHLVWPCSFTRLSRQSFLHVCLLEYHQKTHAIPNARSWKALDFFTTEEFYCYTKDALWKKILNILREKRDAVKNEQ